MSLVYKLLLLYLLATYLGVCLHVGGVLLFLHMIYIFPVSVSALEPISASRFPFALIFLL